MSDASSLGAGLRHGVVEPDSAVASGGAVHIFVQPEDVRILLSGEIDAELARDFRAALDAVKVEGRSVTLDLRHVLFMDSFGVAFVSQLAAACPARVTVTHVPPTVQFILEVTNTAELVDIIPAG